MKPSSAKNAIATEALAAVNRGLRNRLTSIIGAAVARSAATSATRTSAPAASAPSVAAEAQLHPGAWMMPYTIRLIPADDRVKPRQSTGGVRGSRESGTRQATSSPTTAAMGTMNKKMLPHQNRSSSQPPAIGPSAIPTPALAPHSPMASARWRRSVNTLVSSDSAEGNIIAAPSPITARAAVSWPDDVANDPAQLEAPNTARPA